jgi:putative PIG3 family NAD(P)H quinone oxidoreductase
MRATRLARALSRVADGLPERMRAVHIRTVGSNGGPEALEPKSLPLPWDELTPTSVLIRVAYAGVNRPDVLQRRGLYPPPPGHSTLPGLEVSGTIVAVGGDVVLAEPISLGAEVCALTNGGGYAEFVSVDVTACLPLSGSGLSALEAACVPETFCTVWHNVFGQSNAFGERLLQRGGGGDQRAHPPSLLVHGGSSGIGTAAIAMGSALGVDVYATAGTAGKCDACVALGARAAFNYRDDAHWDAALRAERDGRGVDVVLDMVGPAYLARNLASLASGGRVAMIGLLGGHRVPTSGPTAAAAAEDETPPLSLAPLLARRLSVGGATLRPLGVAAKASIVAELRAAVWPCVEAGDVRVVVDSVFDLDDAASAHRRMESGEHVGKIALRVIA